MNWGGLRRVPALPFSRSLFPQPPSPGWPLRREGSGTAGDTRGTPGPGRGGSTGRTRTGTFLSGAAAPTGGPQTPAAGPGERQNYGGFQPGAGTGPGGAEGPGAEGQNRRPESLQSPGAPQAAGVRAVRTKGSRAGQHARPPVRSCRSPRFPPGLSPAAAAAPAQPREGRGPFKAGPWPRPPAPRARLLHGNVSRLRRGGGDKTPRGTAAIGACGKGAGPPWGARCRSAPWRPEEPGAPKPRIIAPKSRIIASKPQIIAPFRLISAAFISEVLVIDITIYCSHVERRHTQPRPRPHLKGQSSCAPLQSHK